MFMQCRYCEVLFNKWNKNKSELKKNDINFVEFYTNESKANFTYIMSQFKNFYNYCLAKKLQ